MGVDVVPNGSGLGEAGCRGVNEVREGRSLVVLFIL